MFHLSGDAVWWGIFKSKSTELSDTMCQRKIIRYMIYRRKRIVEGTRFTHYRERRFADKVGEADRSTCL